MSRPAQICVCLLAIALVLSAANGCKPTATSSTPDPTTQVAPKKAEPPASPQAQQPAKTADTTPPSPTPPKTADIPATPPATPVNKPAPKPEQPAGPSVLLNGDFESGYDGWQVTSTNKEPAVKTDEEVKATGARSLKVMAPGGSAFEIVQWKVPVDKGSKYRLAGQVRTQDLAGQVYLISACGKSGTPGSEWQWASTRKLSGTNDWTKLDATFEVPESSDFCFVRIEYRDPSKKDLKEGSFWVDNVTLNKVK